MDGAGVEVGYLALKNLWLTAYTDILESLRAKWFLAYSLIFGGLAFKKPVIETVDRMDLRVFPVRIDTRGAYSKGGIPLNVHAIANVKISSEPDEIHNAIERFLRLAHATPTRPRLNTASVPGSGTVQL